jgi:Leucine-rich repeat (LRR) protein
VRNPPQKLNQFEKKLEKSKNRFSNLPDSFAQLSPTLYHLILDDNLYQTIPAIMGRLQIMNVFSTQRNQVGDMVALLGCANLEVINILRKNAIDRLPIDLNLRLPKLRI